MNDRAKIGKMLFPVQRKVTISSSALSARFALILPNILQASQSAGSVAEDLTRPESDQHKVCL